MASASVGARAIVALQDSNILIARTVERMAAMNVGPAEHLKALSDSSAINVALLSKLPSSTVTTMSLAAIGPTPSRERLQDLERKQCNIFGTFFNPDRTRQGNKVLRQRLKGPTLAAYYPRRSVTLADLQKDFKRHGLETYDEDQEDRLEGLQIAKLRGKGAPKKKREANTSKKGRRKK